MVSRYLESNREQVALKLGETIKSNGLDFVWVLSPSCSLEVASVLDSVSSLEVISCTEISWVEEVTLALGQA